MSQNRNEFRGSIRVTDDRKAYEHANRRGIITKDTVAIIRHMVAVAIVTAYERFGLLQSTRSADRILHNPPSRAVDLLS